MAVNTDSYEWPYIWINYRDDFFQPVAGSSVGTALSCQGSDRARCWVDAKRLCCLQLNDGPVSAMPWLGHHNGKLSTDWTEAYLLLPVPAAVSMDFPETKNKIADAKAVRWANERQDYWYRWCYYNKYGSISILAKTGKYWSILNTSIGLTLQSVNPNTYEIIAKYTHNSQTVNRELHGIPSDRLLLALSICCGHL